MFIDPTMNPRPALQRSAMFPPRVRDTSLRFAPKERREGFGGAFYKHYVPPGRETPVRSLAKKTKS
jgi:hypothetical protein